MKWQKGEINDMQRLKRPFIWLVLVALVISMFPAGLTQQANAAAASPSAASYFIPDIKSLRDTALLTTTAGPSQITKDTVYPTNNSVLTVTGTYAFVSSDTMKVKIEQLNDDGKGNWVTDNTHFTTGVVVADTNASNRFTASNLNLFSGFNKITFSGMQGGVERSDVFYVLYDRVPFLQSLQIFGGGTNPVNMNEGTQVVVDQQTVTLQGVAQNATQVTVAVNGGTATKTSLLTNGTFFTPGMKLSPGLNKLTIVIKNASDSITISRDVYLYDPKQPVIDLSLDDTAKTASLFGQVPTFTSAASGKLKVKLLLPYDPTSTSFASSGTVTVNSTDVAPYTTSTFTVTNETTIPGPDGVTPTYLLVTLDTGAFSYKDNAGVYPANQNAFVTVTYGGNSSTYKGQFKYLPGDTVISDIKYLPGYKAGDDVTTVTQLPLNGAQLDGPDFYILVTSDTAPTTPLLASYLPVGTSLLSLTKDGSATGLAAGQEVYHITGFYNGQQKVHFQYTGSTSFYNADINYVSKDYIRVDNLYDGQVYTLDSRTDPTILKISGSYVGFQNISNPQFFVNGIKDNLGDGADTTLEAPDFSLNLNIDADGPLVYGENRIVFTATSIDAVGNKREVSKELRIYIIDKNVSNIDVFNPTIGVNREPFAGKTLDTANYPQDVLDKILNVTPEFDYVNGRYETSEQKYDLVLRGGGASIINLNLGSQQFFSATVANLISNTGIGTNGTFTFQGQTYNYDFTGDSTDFILRIQDISFAAPGSHVYNLELINDTGARTSQRLEVTRVVSDYRVLAPKATVGDQIIVNKNFVHIDIEAEGATQVLVEKAPATKRTDLPNVDDRFIYDYVGLKPDKLTKLKIQIVRSGGTLNKTIDVFYTSSVAIDSQYMAEKPSNKYSIFNKNLELTFPKGTLLKTVPANLKTGEVTKFYPDNKFLFGIADPVDGVVERRNDYGNIIGLDKDQRSDKEAITINLPIGLVQRFSSNADTSNFSRISDIYWINGGIAEEGDKGAVGYDPGTNGLTPYSIEGNFTLIPPERKLIPSNRGTLKMKFDPSLVDETGSTITVFRYTDSGEWLNVGGSVDIKNHTITVPFDEFGYYTVMKLRQGFSDITNHPWARNILNGLFSKGIMSSLRPPDVFGADDATTRAEFAALLVKGLNIPLYRGTEQTFYDVVPTAKTTTWDFAHIETAARAGIVSGLSDGYFGTDQPITREQAAVMIARALKLKLALNDNKLQASVSKSYTDSGSMDFYSLPSIDAVSKAKIMQGIPNTSPGQTKPTYTFNPKGTLTRAEAGKIAVELLKKSTNIFPKNLS